MAESIGARRVVVPVRAGAEFCFGRQTLAEEIVRDACSQGCVLLYGGPQAGKSTLLLYVERLLRGRIAPRSDFEEYDIGVYVDLRIGLQGGQARPSDFFSLLGVCRSPGRGIYEVSEPRGPPRRPPGSVAHSRVPKQGLREGLRLFGRDRDASNTPNVSPAPVPAPQLVHRDALTPLILLPGHIAASDSTPCTPDSILPRRRVTRADESAGIPAPP